MCCSVRALSGFSASESRRRWRSVADAVTGREVRDSWGQRLMLRGKREQARPGGVRGEISLLRLRQVVRRGTIAG